jgi:radical SAM protein with 4Fe4S-binding SPASM domain
MERTVGQFEDLRALADSMDSDLVYDTTLVPADDGSDQPLAQAMQPATLQQFYKRYLKEWRLIEYAPGDHPCNTGLNIAAIDPYGNVHPCVQLRMKAGNLREHSFGEIWRESPVLQRMRALTFSQLRECPTCERLPYCVRCTGVAYLETGDVLACSQVAREDARVRIAALEAKGLAAFPGQRPTCEQN